MQKQQMCEDDDGGCWTNVFTFVAVFFLILFLMALFAYPSYYHDYNHPHPMHGPDDEHRWWCRRCMDTSCAVACWRE